MYKFGKADAKKTEKLPCSLLVVSAIFLFMGSLTFQVGTYDINTRVPVSLTNITYYNITGDISANVLTGLNGVASVYLNDTGNYSLRAYNLGYEIYEAEVIISDNATQIINLFPITGEGIIRLRVQDLTFSTNRAYCVYFADNMRLYQCLHTNDTLVLHNSYRYIIMPDVQQSDILTNPNNFKRFNYMWIGTILAGVFMITFIIIILSIGYRIIVKKGL